MLLNFDNCPLFREIATRISKIGRNDLYFDWLQDAIYQLYQRGFRDIYKYIREIWVEESTEETIKRWEDLMALEVDKTYTLDDRITKVLYTLNARYCCTLEFLKQQAMFFTNGKIEIHEDYPNYSFEIEFIGIGIPKNMDNFKYMVELSKPAHLDYTIRYNYRTHGELKPNKHGDLKPYTHDQIYEDPTIL